MGEQRYEIEKRDITAPQDSKIREDMEKGFEQTMESDVAPVKQEAPPTEHELSMFEHTSTRQSTHSQRPRSTVDRMETEVGSPPDEPKSHFLDGKGNLFRATFITTACATQLLSQAGIGMVMIPLHVIGESLGTDDNGQMSWMVASYGLTVGMLLIMAGRLGDLYGPKRWWIIGISVMIVTNIGTGFCKTPIEFDICRALCGIGCALSVPNALAILGRTYPPGFTRNITFALLGALAPVGFWCGGAIGSIFGQLVKVGWIFWFTAMFTAIFLGVGILVLPPDEPHPNPSERHFDWLGAALLALALGLFNFPWNQAPLVGWQEPYVYIIFIISILFFVAFFLWEKHIGLGALIPIEVLKKDSLLVYLCLWLGWMSFGTYLFYLTFFLHDIRGYTHPLTVTAQMFPLVPGGFCAALLVPYLIKKFPGHIIFLFAMFGFMCANLFMATAPVNQVYWANTFVGMLLGMFGPDLSFSTGQLIVSNSVDRNLQGIAAGIVSMITNYSQSIGLGMTGTVESYVRGPGTTYDDLLKGYRAAFYFGTGMAGFAVIVVALFVRMPRAHKSSDVH